jgi:hypothetical protein
MAIWNLYLTKHPWLHLTYALVNERSEARRHFLLTPSQALSAIFASGLYYKRWA